MQCNNSFYGEPYFTMSINLRFQLIYFFYLLIRVLFNDNFVAQKTHIILLNYRLINKLKVFGRKRSCPNLK
jgi:hypothetical protein